MHQDKAIELARDSALNCGERHDYMPATPLLAEDWMPHRWVVDAMLMAAHEAEQWAIRYRNGNTQLLGLLMKLHAGDDILDVVEQAKAVLTNAGLLNSDNTLNWDALEARKPKQQTWAEAVNECVTDPAERARLLALDDTTHAE